MFPIFSLIFFFFWVCAYGLTVCPCAAGFVLGLVLTCPRKQRESTWLSHTMCADVCGTSLSNSICLTDACETVRPDRLLCTQACPKVKGRSEGHPSLSFLVFPIVNAGFKKSSLSHPFDGFPHVNARFTDFFFITYNLAIVEISSWAAIL